MSEWCVKLEGHKFDLEDLPTWFSSPDLKVIEENGEYYLKSREFNSFPEASVVRERAKEILQDINGAAKVHSSEFQPISIGSIMRIDENGRHHYYQEFTETIKLRDKTYVEITKSCSVEEEQETREIIPVESWVTKAKQDRNVKKILRFWSTEETTWFFLYNILDAIEEDIGCKVHEKGWAADNQVNQFTHTANCYAALGLDSRHGRDFKPPDRPMEFSEAQNLIRNITCSWLCEKVGSLSENK